ncbi:MAG: YdcH family protein [Pseudomonadota bacterium]
MSHTPHDLNDEFPGQTDAIHELKLTDAHFRRLFDEYQEVNSAIHLVETRVTPSDDFHEQDLRKARLKLKDQIAAALSRRDA